MLHQASSIAAALCINARRATDIVQDSSPAPLGSKILSQTVKNLERKLNTSTIGLDIHPTLPSRWYKANFDFHLKQIKKDYSLLVVMLLISILCGDKIPNVSGIVLYLPFTYIVSIAPHPHQHRLGLGHCYTNLLIFTYQLFRHQLDDLVFPALLHLCKGLYIKLLRFICIFAT
jgi:hypothetical protein